MYLTIVSELRGSDGTTENSLMIKFKPVDRIQLFKILNKGSPLSYSWWWERGKRRVWPCPTRWPRAGLTMPPMLAKCVFDQTSQVDQVWVWTCLPRWLSAGLAIPPTLTKCEFSHAHQVDQVWVWPCPPRWSSACWAMTTILAKCGFGKSHHIGQVRVFQTSHTLENIVVKSRCVPSLLNKWYLISTNN